MCMNMLLERFHLLCTCQITCWCFDAIPQRNHLFIYVFLFNVRTCLAALTGTCGVSYIALIYSYHQALSFSNNGYPIKMNLTFKKYLDLIALE